MGKQSEKKISANRTKIIITVLLVVTFVALAVTIWALFFRNTGPALAPDYAPQKEEEYAEPVTGDSEEKMEVSKGGGAVSMVYQKEVHISLSDNKATSGTSSWTCQDGADQITVTNNSNADITASLAYGKTDNNITGTFTNSKIGLKSAEGTNVGESPSETTTLSLKGALSDTTAEKKEIGNVTVTISDYVGTSSNYKWDGNGNISWGFLKTTLTDGVYTVEKECPGNNYLASIFYIYNKGNSQEKYVIKDGDIKAEGTYSLQKVTAIVRLATQETVLNSSSRFSGQSTAGEQPAAFFNYT